MTHPTGPPDVEETKRRLRLLFNADPVVARDALAVIEALESKLRIEARAAETTANIADHFKKKYDLEIAALRARLTRLEEAARTVSKGIRAAIKRHIDFISNPKGPKAHELTRRDKKGIADMVTKEEREWADALDRAISGETT